MGLAAGSLVLVELRNDRASVQRHGDMIAAFAVLHNGAGRIATVKLAEMVALRMTGNGLALDVDLHARELLLAELGGTLGLRALADHVNFGSGRIVRPPFAVAVAEALRDSLSLNCRMPFMGLCIGCDIAVHVKGQRASVVARPADGIGTVAVQKLRIMAVVRVALDQNRLIGEIGRRGLGIRVVVRDVKVDRGRFGLVLPHAVPGAVIPVHCLRDRLAVFQPVPCKARRAVIRSQVFVPIDRHRAYPGIAGGVALRVGNNLAQRIPALNVGQGVKPRAVIIERSGAPHIHRAL